MDCEHVWTAKAGTPFGHACERCGKPMEFHEALRAYEGDIGSALAEISEETGITIENRRR